MADVHVASESDLGDALKSNADTIVIEGDLVKKVIRIRATGKIAWVIAIAAIAIAVGIAIASGGAGAPAAVAVGGGAIGILGLPTALAAVAIAVAAGGVGALNRLRTYKQIERTGDRLVLKRK